MKIYPDFSEITQIKMCLCIARVFNDHRSCQKLINYITNIKAKSKRYQWIQKIPVQNRDKFSSVKEQAFNFMWDGINWKKGVNILLTNNR
jgi:hypothetical protein